MPQKSFKQSKILTGAGGAAIAYERINGTLPGIMFLGGFMSNMQGKKATAMEEYCRTNGHAFVRFDYRGHGESSGKISEGTIGSWLSDALLIFDDCTEGAQILIGSSMGGWIMLLLALARPKKIRGLIGIAAAPDFTEDLLWGRFDSAVRAKLEKDGVYYEKTDYGNEPYLITKELIEEGRNHLLLRRKIKINHPVRLLHGMGDESVPWMTAYKLSEKIGSEDVRIVLIKDGDHSLSRDEDIHCLQITLKELLAKD